jgi:hypothetical protein
LREEPQGANSVVLENDIEKRKRRRKRRRRISHSPIRSCDSSHFRQKTTMKTRVWMMMKMMKRRRRRMMKMKMKMKMMKMMMMRRRRRRRSVPSSETFDSIEKIENKTTKSNSPLQQMVHEEEHSTN